MKVHSEWFWSEGSANKAAERMQKKGYRTNVNYAMDASGRHDWLLEVFAD
jgi:hypothetical protein